MLAAHALAILIAVLACDGVQGNTCSIVNGNQVCCSDGQLNIINGVCTCGNGSPCSGAGGGGGGGDGSGSSTPCPPMSSEESAKVGCSSFWSRVFNGWGVYTCSSCSGQGTICPQLPCPPPVSQSGATCPPVTVFSGSCSELEQACAEKNQGPLTQASTGSSATGSYGCFACSGGSVTISDQAGEGAEVRNDSNSRGKIIGVSFACSALMIAFAIGRVSISGDMSKREMVSKAIFKSDSSAWFHSISAIVSGDGHRRFKVAVGLAVSVAFAIAFQNRNLASLQQSSSCELQVSTWNGGSSTRVSSTSSASTFKILEVSLTSLGATLATVCFGALVSFAYNLAELTEVSLDDRIVDGLYLFSAGLLDGLAIVALLDLAKNSGEPAANLFRDYGTVFVLNTFFSWIIFEPLRTAFYRLPKCVNNMIESELDAEASSKTVPTAVVVKAETGSFSS